MGDQPRITSYALPGLLAQVARLTNVEVAVAIARAHGGRRLYLPREPKRTHPLAKLVGLGAARIICAQWGGDRHDIPSAKPFLHWYDARRMRRQGMTYAAISKQLGIGVQHVAHLVADLEDAPGAPAEVADAPSICPVCLRPNRAAPSAKPADERQLTLPIG